MNRFVRVPIRNDYTYNDLLRDGQLQDAAQRSHEGLVNGSLFAGFVVVVGRGTVYTKIKKRRRSNVVELKQKEK